MTHTEKAELMFSQGFNCSQAVLSTFADECGISEQTALKIATQFGGGARKGEMCGAVSGALMVLGLKYGYDRDTLSPAIRSYAYGVAEDFMTRFAQKNGSVVCRDLLGYDVSKPEDMEKIKEQSLFVKVCPMMIRCAVELLDEMLGSALEHETDKV